MRPPRPVPGIVIGLLAGAALVVGGLWLGGRRSDAIAETVPPAVEPATEPIAGTSLGPTVLLPTGLRVVGNEVELAYELVDVAPPPLGDPGPNAANVVAAPELWTLVTTLGEISGTSATTAARTARFPVTAAFDATTVTGARIDAWRVRLPMSQRLDIAHSDTSEHVVEDGTAVALRFVLPQTQSTLVQFTVVHPTDAFSGATGSFSAAFEARPSIRGVGPGWTNVGQTDTGGVQLTYVGPQLPDPFTVRVDTHEWWLVEDPVNVDLSEVLDG